MLGCSDGNTTSTKEKEDKSEPMFFESSYKTIYCGFKIKWDYVSWWLSWTKMCFWTDKRRSPGNSLLFIQVTASHDKFYFHMYPSSTYRRGSIDVILVILLMQGNGAGWESWERDSSLPEVQQSKSTFSLLYSDYYYPAADIYS